MPLLVQSFACNRHHPKHIFPIAHGLISTPLRAKGQRALSYILIPKIVLKTEVQKTYPICGKGGTDSFTLTETNVEKFPELTMNVNGFDRSKERIFKPFASTLIKQFLGSISVSESLVHRNTT